MIIEEDIINMEEVFREACNKVKESLHQKLDNFYTHYREQFINHKTMVDENFKLSKRYTYYNNPNNLGNYTGKKIFDFLLFMKY